MLFAKTAKAVGSQDGAWSQSFSENGLFLVIEIRDIFEPAILGRNIINHLKEQFVEKEKVNLKFITDALAQLPLSENTHLLLAYQTETASGDVLYLAGHGQVEAWMKRESKTALILKDTSSSSGFLQEGDFLLLTTPSFRRIFSFSEFANLNCNSSYLKDHEEKLAAIITAEKENAGAAVLLICFLKKKEQEETTPKKTFLDKWHDLTKQARQKIEEREDLKESFSKKKKLTISIGVLLSILIVASLFFGNYQKVKLANEKIFSELQDKVSEKIAQGKALTDLNPNQARKHLSDAKQIIEETLPQFTGEKSKPKEEAEKLLASVNEGLVLAERVFKVEDAPLFFDLSWIKENAKGKSLALYKNTLVVLDSENKNVYRLFLDSKKSELLASGDILANGLKITLSPSGIFILLKENGQYKVIDEKLQTVVESDEEWGEIADLASFAGNLYLLDRNGKIWKYQGVEAGFASKKNYLSEDVSLDFSTSSTLRIDGSVWVLNQENIYKFTRGIFENFNIAENDLTNIINFYLDDGTSEVYFLSKNNNLTAFNKDANYKSRYEWEKLTTASDFAVSQSLNKILILIDGKIYALEIKS